MNSKPDRKHLVTRPWRMLRPLRGWRTVLAIGTVAIYTAIFFPLYHLMDGGAAALSVIPVAVAGWLFGMRAGVLAGVLAFFLNTLLNLADQPGWDAVIRAGGAPGSAALLLIGAVVGRLHDLEAHASHEIAERRRIEEALQKSEERLRTIVSNVPIILFAVDKAGVFTLSEGKGLETLKAKPGEVVDRSVADVYRNTPAIIEHVERALAGEPVTATVDVAGLTFEAHYTPVYGDDYEVTGVIGVAIDVTEQRRHQAEVEAARTFLQTLLESSPDSIIAADMNGQVTVFNSGAEELLGYSAAEILGQPVERLYPSREAAKAVMRAMRADPFGIAKGSVYETVNIMVIIGRRGHLEREAYREHYQSADDLAAMITGLMRAQ